MAESKNNIVTHGLSGKVGDLLVFSQRNGKTIVSKAPKERTGELSDKQEVQKLKFQRAVLYAKAVMNDPDKKQMYETMSDDSKGISAYNVAVADLLMHQKFRKSIFLRTQEILVIPSELSQQMILKSYW